jgi:hypothetical protein
MERAGLHESLQSAKNRVFWELRMRLRWSRGGYRESGSEALALDEEEARLEREFGFSIYRSYLSPDSYRKNLWTLALLRHFLPPHLRSAHLPLEVLEPGCQDFSRLPALRAFFRKQGLRPRITGLELDPFPVLHDLRSRWDKAKYYLSCEKSADRYLDADFFRWDEAADLVCCFYPFVSAPPALAWGLPARFGNPKPWVGSFCRNLRPDGLLLVVHQGDWEEEDFDSARAGCPLRLVQRETFERAFYPLPYPACVSVYRRER